MVIDRQCTSILVGNHNQWLKRWPDYTVTFLHVNVVTSMFFRIFRYAERTNIEIQLFNIQTKLRAAKQKNWYPPEGKLVSDINKVIYEGWLLKYYMMLTTQNTMV